MAPSATPSPSPTASADPTPTPFAYGLQPIGQHSGTPQLLGRIDPASLFVSPHSAYALATAACAQCHRAHSAAGSAITPQPSPESGLCFTCHDSKGSGSVFKTAAELAGVPANDPAQDAWYSHLVTSPTTHTGDATNEFGGVLNRHSTCSDCHDSHNATETAPVEGSQGWSASGSISGASSVKVTNHLGSGPTYELVQGPTTLTGTGAITGGVTGSFEYQLCFKCHSGFTQLTSHASEPAASRPSWWALDKGIELDPLNATSFHPVEARGTNQTPAMTLSLAGASTYKLWNFTATDTVRCTNCHAGPTTPPAGTTSDALLPVHASSQRGILVAPYRDRQLKPAGETYASADSALCYLCHAEAPMTDPTATTATNFAGTPGAPFAATYQSLHALHLAGIGTLSTGTAGAIDTPGAGPGNATCAECHFRLHSTALAYNLNDRGNTRLVNFAPDVIPAGGTLSWTSTGVSQGSCTLTCHGYTHKAVAYGP